MLSPQDLFLIQNDISRVAFIINSGWIGYNINSVVFHE
jgi:hypothetical protein